MTRDKASETKAIEFYRNQPTMMENLRETSRPSTTQDKLHQESLLQKHKAENPADPWYFTHT